MSNNTPPSISGQQLGAVGTWLSIVTQLYNTRMQKLLSHFDVTLTQFAVLNYLARHQGQQATISSIAAAIEVNQPGATKIVKKFTDLGYVEVTRDANDARKRFVAITGKGLAFIGEVMQSMGPDFSQWFTDWDPEDLAQFIGHLQKLGSWLDENRLD